MTQRCGSIRFYCTRTKRDARPTTNSYSNTISLPRTKLPLKLKGKALIERDVDINNVRTLRDHKSLLRRYVGPFLFSFFGFIFD